MHSWNPAQVLVEAWRHPHTRADARRVGLARVFDAARLGSLVHAAIESGVGRGAAANAPNIESLYRRLGFTPPTRLFSEDAKPAADSSSSESTLRRLAADAVSGTADSVREPIAVIVTGPTGGWKHAAVELIRRSLSQCGGVVVVDQVELAALMFLRSQTLPDAPHAIDLRRGTGAHEVATAITSNAITKHRHIMFDGSDDTQSHILALRSAGYTIYIVSAVDTSDDALRNLLDARDDAREHGFDPATVSIPPKPLVSRDCIESMQQGIALASSRGVAALFVVNATQVHEVSGPDLLQPLAVRAAFGLSSPNQAPTPSAPAQFSHHDSERSKPAPTPPDLGPDRAPQLNIAENASPKPRTDPSPDVPGYSTQPKPSAQAPSPPPQRVAVPRSATRRTGEDNRRIATAGVPAAASDRTAARQKLPPSDQRPASPIEVEAESAEPNPNPRAVVSHSVRERPESGPLGSSPVTKIDQERVAHRRGQVQRLCQYAKVPFDDPASSTTRESNADR